MTEMEIETSRKGPLLWSALLAVAGLALLLYGLWWYGQAVLTFATGCLAVFGLFTLGYLLRQLGERWFGEPHGWWFIGYLASITALAVWVMPWVMRAVDPLTVAGAVVAISLLGLRHRVLFPNG